MIGVSTLEGQFVASKKGRPRAADTVEKTSFLRWTERIINWTATGLALWFGWLLVRDIQADAILTPLAADILWRVALVTYYWSWIAGTRTDTRSQGMAYVSFPGQGKWPKQAFIALVIFVGVAVLLLWSRGSVRLFALALTAFTIVDHGIWWFYMRGLLHKAYLASRDHYAKTKDNYHLEILQTVHDQIYGRWKLRRLTAGALIIILLNVFSFNDSAAVVAAAAVLAVAPWLSPGDAALLAYTVLVAAFVGVMEGWHWAVRIVTATKLKLLGNLSRRYDLVALSGAR